MLNTSAIYKYVYIRKEDYEVEKKRKHYDIQIQ